MWAITTLLPYQLPLTLPSATAIAASLAFAGLGVAFFGVLQFRRSRTTVNPIHPEHSSTLVCQGVYRFTRNPMYLGFLLGLIGWGIYLGNLLAMGMPVIYVIYMNRFQIAPEERILEDLFGDDFQRYKKVVRRWI